LPRPLQPTQTNLVIAEAFGIRPNGLGEQLQVVAQAFGHDIKVTPRLFGLLPNFFAEPTELKVNLPKSLIDSLESLVDPPEPRVHGSFELGNRHRLTRSAHHSIVVYAMTMP
jgi:hypothetical protein